MNARKPPHRVDQAEAVKNATNAGRLAISLVPAPNPPALVEALTTVVVTVAVEASALLGAEVEKPGMVDHQFLLLILGLT